jgi:hypothetical protein
MDGWKRVHRRKTFDYVLLRRYVILGNRQVVEALIHVVKPETQDKIRPGCSHAMNEVAYLGEQLSDRLVMVLLRTCTARQEMNT